MVGTSISGTMHALSLALPESIHVCLSHTPPLSLSLWLTIEVIDDGIVQTEGKGLKFLLKSKGMHVYHMSRIDHVVVDNSYSENPTGPTFSDIKCLI